MNIGNVEQVEDVEILPVGIDTKKTKCKKVYTKFGKVIKRIIDILGALVGMIALLPITIVVFIANLFKKNKTKIFYTQNRIGKDGKLFKLYKFQTMIPNADEYLFKYLEENPEAKEEYSKNKKLKNDPRVTEIGKVLRKTSLDEFPQFFNVLKGDMSLVGPRPYLPREQEEMGEHYYNIVKVQPGITGPWQVGGRSDLTFEERLNIEGKYAETANFRSDMSILFKTVESTVNKKGAI